MGPSNPSFGTTPRRVHTSEELNVCHSRLDKSVYDVHELAGAEDKMKDDAPWTFFFDL